VPLRLFHVALVAVGVLRLAVAALLPLTGDEAYYWEYARHLALGYHDHPPLVGWIIAASTGVFGDTALAVRGPFVLLGLASAALLCRATREATRSDAAGAWAGLMVLVTPLFGVAGMAAFPDSPLLFAASLFLWASWRALSGGGRLYWLATGFAAGMAGISKLTGLYMLPSLALAMVIHGPWRAWWRRPDPWLALGVFLAVLSPLAYWNATHGWESFAYQYGSRLGASQGLQLSRVPTYVAFGAAALSPLLFPLVVWATVRAAISGVREGGAAPTLFACLALPIHLFFFACAFVTKAGIHWTAPGTLAAFGAFGWWLAAGPWTLARKSLLAVGLALGLAITGVVYVAALSPATVVGLVRGGVQMAGVNKGRTLTVNELAEIFGYPAGAAHIHAVADDLRARGATPFIFTTNYALSSALAFYSGETVRVVMGTRIGAEFNRWDDYPSLLGSDALYVDTMPVDQREDVWRLLHEAFEKVEPLEPFPTEARGVGSRTFYLVRCTRFRDDVFTPLKTRYSSWTWLRPAASGSPR